MGIAVKAAQLVSILLKLGFRITRQTGSHIQLIHILDSSKRVTISMSSKELPIKTLKSILKQSGMTMEELLKLIGR